jgi:hypothetical protein
LDFGIPPLRFFCLARCLLRVPLYQCGRFCPRV